MPAVPCPSGQPWDGGRAVVATLRAAGYEAWFVGGCVRDLLLDQPVTDVDVATNAHPHHIERLFPKTIAVGKAFGVMIVVLGDQNIEVATFRHDGAYIDGRRPTDVTFSTAVEDVQRRDFTINALLFDPESGAVIDHVGGLNDLQNGIIRTVGDPWQRFREDRLRQIRALRFAARFGFTIAADTWAALCATPATDLSRERIHQEWTKGLSLSQPWRWAELVRSAGLDGLFLPSALLQEAWNRLNAVLSQIKPDVPLIARQALWLHLHSLAEVRGWLENEPVAKALRHNLLWLLEESQADRWQQATRAQQCRVARHPAAQTLIALCRCRHGDQHPMVRELVSLYDQAQAAGPFVPLLRPADLVALGISPGPALGRILSCLEDAQLEGRLTSVEQARTMAVELWTATSSMHG